MELTQLETFLAVAEERSFSRAAARLHRTQPAVSQVIRKLEEDVGEKLFDRSARDGALTAAGELLREYAQRLLALRREASTALDELKSLERGRLQIAANEYTCLYLLPALDRFRREFPHIDVVVHRMLASHIPEELKLRSIEMGVVSILNPSDESVPVIRRENDIQVQTLAPQDPDVVSEYGIKFLRRLYVQGAVGREWYWHSPGFECSMFLLGIDAGGRIGKAHAQLQAVRRTFTPAIDPEDIINVVDREKYHDTETMGGIFAGVNAWWRANAAAGKTSIVYAYALGKAQRVMAGVDATIGPIFTHGAVEKVTRAYRDSGVSLPPTTPVSEAIVERGKPKPWSGGLVIAPPSASGSVWVRKFEPASEAIASGWMTVRGARRRKAVDRGFPLSDHADWPGLLAAVRETGATRVLATHGFAGVLARHLREQGLDADVIATRFGDEEEGAEPAEEATA